jgi:CelD/BcsL family acetyltransferase involved in cellulose biosynthesis
LVLETEQPEVFLTWEWAAAVGRAYGNSLKPWIGTAYKGNVLVGVAALAKTSPTEAVFLAGTTADYCDFLSHPSKRQEFVSQVLKSLREDGIQTVTLANLPADSATMAALKAEPSFRIFARPGYVCARVQLGSKSEGPALVLSFLKKKSLRWALNSLERVGPVMLRHELEFSDAQTQLNSFFTMHVARFLSTGRISNLVRPERRRFLIELAQLLGERGWFDLMSLWAGSRAVAYNYGFRFHKSWFLYQPTFENEFEQFSPGLCLLAKMVEAAFEEPETLRVDLGLGAEGYKERFANAGRETLHVTLTSRAIRHWSVRGRYQAAEAIKKQPRLEAVARRAQKAIVTGRQQAREGGLLGWSRRSVQRVLSGRHPMCLYQWDGSHTAAGNEQRLSPVDWEALAVVAMRYHDEQETLDYLLRASGRLRAQHHRGYVLVGEDGVAQHFGWVASDTGVAGSEAEEVLPQISSNSVMIFDGWTSGALQGQGHYVYFLQQLAELLFAEGKDVFVLTPAAGSASRSEMESAGFRMEFARRKRPQKDL